MLKIKVGFFNKFFYVARLINNNPDPKSAITYAFYIEIEKKYLLSYVVAHELVHVMQFWKNPLKWLWWQITNNQDYQIEIESEAYAAEMIIRANFDKNKISDELITSYAKVITYGSCYNVDDNKFEFVKSKVKFYTKKWFENESLLKRIYDEALKIVDFFQK